MKTSAEHNVDKGDKIFILPLAKMGYPYHLDNHGGENSEMARNWSGKVMTVSCVITRNSRFDDEEYTIVRCVEDGGNWAWHELNFQCIPYMTINISESDLKDILR